MNWSEVWTIFQNLFMKAIRKIAFFSICIQRFQCKLLRERRNHSSVNCLLQKQLYIKSFRLRCEPVILVIVLTLVLLAKSNLICKKMIFLRKQWSPCHNINLPHSHISPVTWYSTSLIVFTLFLMTWLTLPLVSVLALWDPLECPFCHIHNDHSTQRHNSLQSDLL